MKKRTNKPHSYVSSNSDSGIGGRECELPVRRLNTAVGAGYSSGSSTTLIGADGAPTNKQQRSGKKKSSPPKLKVTFEEPLPKFSEEKPREMLVKADVHEEKSEVITLFN